MRAILLAVIFVWVAAAQDAAMMQADRAFLQAEARADKPALGELLDADFTWTDFEGKTWSRAEVLRDLPKGAIEDESSAQVRQYVYGEIGDVQANLGRDHILRVWVKRPGGWEDNRLSGSPIARCASFVYARGG